nr:MAG TPA: hypothetical protein [Caudoviricetes sp.]
MLFGLTPRLFTHSPPFSTESGGLFVERPQLPTHHARTRFDTHRQNAHRNQEKRTNALPNKKEFAPLQC